MSIAFTVDMGESKVVAHPDLLRVFGVGSCVVVLIYSGETRIGGLAHVVLASLDETSSSPEGRTAIGVAIERLIDDMRAKGVRTENMNAKVFGGSNMFPNIIESASILDVGKRNVDAAIEELRTRGIAVVAEDVGGNAGRSIWFDPGDGLVTVKTAFLGDKQFRFEVQ